MALTLLSMPRISAKGQGCLIQTTISTPGSAVSATLTAMSAAGSWVLGWEATTLLPLPTNQLNDTQTNDPGVNPPAGQGTDLFFVTGNSDCNFFLSPHQCPSATTYDGTTNIQDSVVSIKADLTGILGIFNHPNPLQLDSVDGDFGSGGVLLVNPSQSTNPLLAVAAS
jgi:hypothetical protein